MRVKILITFLLLSFSLFANATDILLSWDTPTEREDGSQSEQIDRYNLYTTFNNVLQDVNEISGDATSFQLSEVEAGNYTFQISTVEAGLEGVPSDPASVYVPIKTNSRPAKFILTIQAVD